MADPAGGAVLLVEDEPAIADNVIFALKGEGLAVEWRPLGSEAVALLSRKAFDLVILDVGLPDGSGFERCKEIRAFSQVPIVFLTARSDEVDRVVGFEIGGDDYVTKPFSLEEVVARLRALMRRTGAQQATSTSVLVVGDLTMDEDSREVTRDGQDISLTATEFELLRFLMRNPKRVLSKAQILDRVWNYDFGGQANVVELYISYLRKKIDAGREPMIHTMRGAGYVLKPATVDA